MRETGTEEYLIEFRFEEGTDTGEFEHAYKEADFRITVPQLQSR